MKQVTKYKAARELFFAGGDCSSRDFCKRGESKESRGVGGKDGGKFPKKGDQVAQQCGH